MDRRVKERLVGASILVALIVLIVPELLSGPPRPAPASVGPRLPVGAPEPVRNITVDLTTSKAAEPETEGSASSARPSQAEVHAVEGASAVTGADASTGSSDAPPSAPPPKPVPPAPLETAPAVPMSTSAKPAMVGKAWAVQLGSFASRANADKLVRQLKAQGFSVYVAPGGSGPSLRYRVRVGPMVDRGTAAQTVAKLKSVGQTASLVPPAP